MGALGGIGSNVTLLSSGKSELDKLVEKYAEKQGREVVPDQSPERGDFFKSDHVEFAKVGVPVIWVVQGPDEMEKGKGYMDEVYFEYANNCYHKPCDEVKDSWVIEGILLDFELIFNIGNELANSELWPEWNPGVEFGRK